MKVAVACRGTGGHVFPGLATARELLRRGHEVTLWLTGRDTEQAARKDWDGPVVEVAARGLVRGHVGRGTFVCADPTPTDAPFAWRGKVVIAGRWTVPAWRYLKSAFTLFWREAGF